MEDWILGITLALCIIVPCWMALFVRAEVQRQLKAWPELARRTGLTYDANVFNVPKGLYPYPGLRGEYRGRTVSIKLFGDADADHNEPPNTIVSLHLQNCASLSFSMQAKMLQGSIPGPRELSSGSLSFDQRFSITGSPPEFLQTAVRRIIGGDPGLLAWILRNRPSLQLQGDTLSCRQNGVLTKVDDQNAFLDLLCDLAELAEKTGTNEVNAGNVMSESKQ